MQVQAQEPQQAQQAQQAGAPSDDQQLREALRIMMQLVEEMADRVEAQVSQSPPNPKHPQKAPKRKHACASERMQCASLMPDHSSHHQEPPCLYDRGTLSCTQRLAWAATEMFEAASMSYCAEGKPQRAIHQAAEVCLHTVLTLCVHSFCVCCRRRRTRRRSTLSGSRSTQRSSRTCSGSACAPHTWRCAALRYVLRAVLQQAACWCKGWEGLCCDTGFRARAASTFEGAAARPVLCVLPFTFPMPSTSLPTTCTPDSSQGELAELRGEVRALRSLRGGAGAVSLSAFLSLGEHWRGRG